MKNFYQFCRKGFAMWILVLALACPALAGDIPYPGVATPPPTATGDIQFPGVASPQETINGEIPYPGVAMNSTEGIALTLWQSVLSIF
jgi:hypothetical protein